ncbi:18461_t:CDS:2 [Gigaspora margarita]|uniref:18461_t:CDS:1 n=1 Tax=Gigaspora margarita TaxID=4874 RepID=A0ABN7UXZ8_GIGMA|nr:18461_t:CDS:2 [Gigaspora margarita]
MNVAQKNLVSLLSLEQEQEQNTEASNNTLVDWLKDVDLEFSVRENPTDTAKWVKRKEKFTKYLALSTLSTKEFDKKAAKSLIQELLQILLAQNSLLVKQISEEEILGVIGQVFFQPDRTCQLD